MMGYFLCHCIQTGSGAHPTSYPIGIRKEALFPKIKWSGHEANHLSPSIMKVMNMWSCISTLPICLHSVVLNQARNVFMAQCLVKNKDNFTFNFI
jgi:hypothetical protein